MGVNDDARGEFDAKLELLWDAPKVKTRGPRPLHTLDDVLDAAIRVADSEGLDAVSMQRLAQELGFTKMAIYRYVPGRAELVALITDRAIGAPPSTFNGKGWRKRMESRAHAVFSVFPARLAGG